MRKKVLLAIAMLISVASFAQKKGDMSVTGIVSVDFGFYTTSFAENNYSTTEKVPYGTSFSVGADYGYFVADNLKLSLAVDVPVTNYCMGKDENDKWLYNKSVSLATYPNVSYYVKLGERFYYTPEIGILFEWRKLKEQLTSSNVETSKIFSWGGYLDFLAFEYKVSERIAIATHIGSLYGISSDYSYENTNKNVKMNELFLSLNNTSVRFRLYF